MRAVLIMILLIEAGIPPHAKIDQGKGKIDGPTRLMSKGGSRISIQIINDQELQHSQVIVTGIDAHKPWRILPRAKTIHQRDILPGMGVAKQQL